MDHEILLESEVELPQGTEELIGQVVAAVLEQQGVENVDDYIEALLRNQCVVLCSRVYAARTE